MLQEVLVFDIETSSFDLNNNSIDLKNNFDEYIKYAITKWVGCYSYKYDKYYNFNAITQRDEIYNLFNLHQTIVGFNSEDFDLPILKSNNLIPNKYFKHIDIMKVLGINNYKPGYKQRSVYMGVKLQETIIDGKVYGKNSLQGMAKAFHIDTLKGDINYDIFNKNSWNNQEIEEIIKYLQKDVEITKLLFDKTFNFWKLFADWLYPGDVKKWAWIDSTIAVLTYLAACKIKNVEPTFGKKGAKEEMGGRAVIPTQEETFGAHYLDETSKYPHLFSEFNLFSEVDVTGKSKETIQKAIDMGLLFHGNEKFKCRGYYDIRKHGNLEIALITKLKTRFAIKKVLKNYKKTGIRDIEVPELLKDVIPDNKLTDEIIEKLQGLEYAIKIFANSLYGAVRDAVFEQISTPNAGYDCCWIGQQLHKYVQDFLESKGFKVVGGFTDSWFVENKNISADEITKLVNNYLNELKQYMPFPEDTHTIGYECYIDYIVYNKDKKTNQYKKNNYAFISDNKIKIVGFPIKKENANKLSLYLFKNFLEKEALEKGRIKFDKSYLNNLIHQELQKDITLAAVNFKCNDFNSYKKEGQIQAQISKHYLDGKSGNINVIKNTKYGKVGQGDKYCSIDEVKKYNIQIKDLVLDKVWNELEPFIITPKTMSLEDWGF